MSNFKVPLTQIREILPHGNAERLEVAVVYGFQVVVRKDTYKVGDQVIYCPIDAILPVKVQDIIFPPDAKIKLNKSRVRQIRIRGLASQGMLINLNEVKSLLLSDSYHPEHDLAGELGITKYEPPEVKQGTPGAPGTPRNKKRENPLFHQYNGLDNIKWYPDKFKPDEMVVFQEKIHGTNARAALMPYAANTIWKRILKFVGLAPTHEFCYGSNTVQLQNKPGHTGFYGEDIYGKVFAELKAEEKLKPGESIYGEIYGANTQKNYSYGLPNERRFLLFDVKILNADGTYRWLDPDEVQVYADQRGFKTVPELYRGPFVSLEFAKTYTVGPSMLTSSQPVREGIVVKAYKNYDEYGNKRALKVISEAYLDDHTNTDGH